LPETIAQDKLTRPKTRGIECGPGACKFLYRIRHVHIAEHYSPLIAAKAIGAVKLDLVLRAIALQPEHAGKRKPGFVLWDWQYEHLHNLAKLSPPARRTQNRSDRATRHLKRKWVSTQLSNLADLELVTVRPRHGARPEIIVLSDLGKRPLDDPGAEGGYDDDRYVTIRGSVIASGTLAKWGAPEVASYLAALYAEFYTDRGAGRAATSDGTGAWWRQLAWFNNPNWFPQERVLLPFSKSLLEDGFNAHATAGLISRTKLKKDPRTNQPFDTPRVKYWNHFNKLDQKVRRIAPERYIKIVDAGAQTVPF